MLCFEVVIFTTADYAGLGRSGRALKASVVRLVGPLVVKYHQPQMMKDAAKSKEECGHSTEREVLLRHPVDLM